MRLASYIARGRTSFGAVLGDVVVDFRVRFGSRFASLVDLIRADALDEARAVLAGVRPDFKLAEIALLPPLLTPEKILCIGMPGSISSEVVIHGPMLPDLSKFLPWVTLNLPWRSQSRTVPSLHSV